MFQIQNRVTSITLNDQQRSLINSKIQLFQEKTGVQHTLIKELFDHLLDVANSSENNEEAANLQAKVAELEAALQASENNSNSDEFERLKAENNELKIENSELKAENTRLSKELEDPEIIVKDIFHPFKPETGDIYIQLDDSQKQVFEAISNNRLKAKHDKVKKTNSELASILLFNRATLFNWGGEVYTGL